MSRYGRRTARYDLLAEWVARISQERERAYTTYIRDAGVDPARARLLEIGCGTGQNLLFYISRGFAPHNLVGNELIEARQDIARANLPSAVRIIGGDATQLDVRDVGQFEIVAQHLVFSSILDDGFRKNLAAKIWELVVPGGAVLWYDMRVDNPRNPDVRGIPRRELVRLFPEATLRCKSVTLAPPLARLACGVSGRLYPVLNSLPFLRTHLVCWLTKQR